MTFDELGGWPATLTTLARSGDLTSEHAASAMREVLSGAATPAQLAGFVVAMRMKGETVEELSGMLDAMLEASNPVVLPDGLAARAVDNCGTGGDRSHSINISTLAAFVLAAGGVPVCKHGNRAASSACGTADLLEELGVTIALDGPGVARCVEEVGMGFCLATHYHPSMRHAGPVRRELGVPTAFNILGPLANPARVARQLVGVADEVMAERMLAVLAARGSRRAAVVHGHDGLDELTTTTTSSMWLLADDGRVQHLEVDPVALGLDKAEPGDLRGGDPATNAAYARRVLAGEKGPHRDVVVLNAGAGFLVGGVVDELADGIARAEAVLDGGGAAAVLERLVQVSAHASSSG